MGTKTVSEGSALDRRVGRPKGIPSNQSQRILDEWDSMKSANPHLNNQALLSMVAESLFGQRLNAAVRKKDKDRLKRTLKRHGRI